MFVIEVRRSKMIQLPSGFRLLSEAEAEAADGLWKRDDGNLSEAH